MIEVFFPPEMSYSECLGWARSRGLQPGWFVMSLTRPTLGYVFKFYLL